MVLFPLNDGATNVCYVLLTDLYAVWVIGPSLTSDSFFGDYGQTWFAVIAPVGIVVSVLLTMMVLATMLWVL